MPCLGINEPQKITNGCTRYLNPNLLTANIERLKPSSESPPPYSSVKSGKFGSVSVGLSFFKATGLSETFSCVVTGVAGGDSPPTDTEGISTLAPEVLLHPATARMTARKNTHIENFTEKLLHMNLLERQHLAGIHFSVVQASRLFLFFLETLKSLCLELTGFAEA
jgi:hypothetical protein